MGDTRKIYLTKKEIDLKKLPLEGSYVKYVEIPYNDILLIDELFLKENIFSDLDLVFGPGDCDYLDTEKCKSLLNKINNIIIDEKIKKTIDLIKNILLEAINCETGVFFDF